MKKRNGKILIILFAAAITAAVYFCAGENNSEKKDTAAENAQIAAEETVNPTALPTEKPTDVPKEQTAAPQKTTETKEEEKSPEIPAEPAKTAEGEKDDEKELSCFLSVSCAALNDKKLAPEKAGFVPPGGVILSETKAVFYEGESVFNVTLREMKKHKIHFEFVKTPVYNSVYVEGIANIYEFDCGELSGWLYRVNGEFPQGGCSRYTLKNGDRIEWVYTCDMGRDVGAVFSEKGGQKDE